MRKLNQWQPAGLRCLASLGLLMLAGCGGSGDKITLYDVSGTVSYNGEPVPFGSVLFLADADEGNAGPQGVAEIEDGKFDTSVAGRGVVGGAYKVIIQGRKEQSSADDDEGAVVPPLFTDYTTSIVFPEENSVQTFEVPAQTSRSHE